MNKKESISAQLTKLRIKISNREDETAAELCDIQRQLSFSPSEAILTFSLVDEIERLRRSNAALHGVITKMKKERCP